MWQNDNLLQYRSDVLLTFSFASSMTASVPKQDCAYRVKNSPIHGRGVFASRKIRAGEFIVEYLGDHITYEQACEDLAARDDDSHHTFLFSLENGEMIDGGRHGNDARYINHCCEPNCEAREEDNRIYIHALRDIVRGEELNFDYGLVLEARYTKALKAAYACRCGTSTCRHTMLAPKGRKSR